MIAAAAASADDGRTVDAFLGGRVTLVQPRKGHRAGLDAALLQALIPATAAGVAIDLGAGIGTVAFCIAARAAGLTVIGVERDADLVECGRSALGRPENAGFAGRVSLVAADVTNSLELADRLALREGTADFVVMNPPFLPEGRGSQSPDTRRRQAHAASEALLPSWTAAAATLLKPGGTLALIHRADALPEVLDALAAKFGAIGLRPVHPTEDAPATRILVTARRGSRAPFALLPGLVLHLAGGNWTPRADAILRGREELGL